MTNKIGYIILYFLTFVAITGIIYFLNLKYTNIFVGDFTPAPNPYVVNRDLSYELDSLKNYYRRTRIDTLYIYQDSTLLNKITNLDKTVDSLNRKIVTKNNLINKKDQRIASLENIKTVEPDSAHAAWLAETVKFFDKMNAKKAAEIIKSYPEKQAREILYSMKKRKAGEILSSMDTKTVTKLTGEY